MSNRFCLRTMLLVGCVLPFTGCSNSPSLTSIAVTPTTVSATAGATFQFTAIGSYTRPNHTPVTRDITDEVTWTSSSDQMVTVSNTGFSEVTGQSTGTSSISASAPGFHGIIIGTSAVTVTKPTTSSRINSISIVGSSRTSLNGAPQYKVVGVTAEGEKLELSDRLTWSSSNPENASVDAVTGSVKPVASGRATITAVYTNPDGTMTVGATHLQVAEN